MDYNKLVRDRIPEIIRGDGKNPVTYTASDEEYMQKLKEKLQEEASEFIKSESYEELADILEVIYALCDLKKISRLELEALRENKAKERGAFKQRIILDEVKEFDL